MFKLHIIIIHGQNEEKLSRISRRQKEWTQRSGTGQPCWGTHGCCPIGPLIGTSLLGIPPPPPHLMIIISAHHHDHYHITLFTQNVVWRASLLCPILMMLRSLQTSEHIKQSMIDQPWCILHVYMMHVSFMNDVLHPYRQGLLVTDKCILGWWWWSNWSDHSDKDSGFYLILLFACLSFLSISLKTIKHDNWWRIIMNRKSQWNESQECLDCSGF